LRWLRLPRAGFRRRFTRAIWQSSGRDPTTARRL
jgi:hypothetical protein